MNGSWRPLVRRLYALALGSVALSLVTALVVAGLVQPPPSPGIVHAALWRLAQSLDRADAVAPEIERLGSEAGLHVTLYTADGALVASSDGHPSPLPPEGERFGGVIDGRGPLVAFDGPPGPGPPGSPGPRGRPPGGDRGPRAPLGFVHGDHVVVDRVIAPSGTVMLAVIVLPGDGFKLALVGGAVAVLLALFAVPFATTLTRPLGELARATRSFGGGDVAARVDIAKAGAFTELARTFNEMAERVTGSMRTEKELLANVSHELRTPLSRIRVALDLAAEGDTEMARESLRDIEGDLGELERLVDDILTHARLESARSPLGTPLRRAPVALSSLLADAAQRFATAHPGHVLARSVDGVADTSLDVDAVLLRRALDNVLDNAGKYSAAGSTVTIAAERTPSDVVIAITDRGVGMTEEDRAQLFVPFFRADKSRTRASGGIGLGLVLAKRIVEAHGGTIAVESALGQGTTVTVRLPV